MGKFARKNQKEARQDAKKATRKPRVKSDNLVDEDATNQVDVGSSDYMYDDADQYQQKKQKKLLERGFQEADDDTDSEEEVMPVDGDTSEEDSEDETQAGDEEDGDLPNRSAWGNKRANFYHTDFVDKDHGRFQGSDAEEAEEEEREAKELQAKLAKELTDDDFGIFEAMDTLEPSETSSQPKLSTFEDVEKMCVDLSKLSEFEKMERIKLESPELLDLISDCVRKMKELCEVIQPLLTAISSSDSPILTERAELYLRTKHQLILGYCQNLNFYMSLKAKRVSVENHPVTRRLVDFRRFLLKLDPLEKMYSQHIASAMALLKEKSDLRQMCRQPAVGGKKRRVTFSDTVRASSATELGRNAPMSKRVKEAVPAKAKKPSSASEDSGEDDETADQGGAGGKRRLTYQIEKNKGTTPYRKKEYRNPRVKHRIKYRKAQISRKGQVHTHRPEVQKYSGEMTGIRAGVVRSVKFK